MAIQVYFDGALIRQLGAYIKTDLSAIRQINGVATGVIGALGLAEGGEENVPYSVRSHAEAVAIFKDGPLVNHIKTMFLGGAGEVIAVRIGNPQASSLSVELDDGDSGTFTLDFSSIEKSSRANNVLIQLDVDDQGNVGDDTDDTLVLTVMQKNADCTVTKEIYEFPRVFSTETVLYRRGDVLYFVQDWIVQQAVSTLSNSATQQQKEEALTAALQDLLLPDDQVQFFDAGDSVPMGLMLYEVNMGNLFGYERSRIVELTLNSSPFSNPLEITDAFNTTPSSFFDNNTNSYAFTEIALDTYTNPLLIDNNAAIISDFYALTGGSNGDDGTDYYGTGLVTTIASSDEMMSWVSGLQVLENEEVNFIQPCYQFQSSTVMGPDAETEGDREALFNAVMGYILSHVKVQSSVSQRSRRTSIIGFPAPHNASYEKTSYLNKAIANLTALTFDTDRVQDWIAPFQSSVVTGTRELLGGEVFASYIAGQHANREPQVSLTFNSVGSIGAEFLYDWTYNEKDRLISQRKAFAEKVKNSVGATVYRIHHNPTSWLGAVTTGYQEFILRRIDDYVSTLLFKNVEETFIGGPSFGERTSGQIRRYVQSLLNSITNQQIVSWKDVAVTANEDNTVYNVEFFVQPITEIKFILMTMKVSFSLEENI